MVQKSPFLVSFVNCQFEETTDQIVYASNAQDAEDQTLRAFSSAHRNDRRRDRHDRIVVAGRVFHRRRHHLRRRPFVVVAA